MWNPSSVILGIRHERVFGFLGRAGDILDAVRRSEGGKVVPSKLFSKIQWPNQITARMLNNDQSVTVDFSIEGVVLNVDLDKMGWSRQRANELFLDLVRIAFQYSGGETSINRIGIVDNYVFDHDAPGRVAAGAITTLQGIGDPTDFTFRASFKNAVPEVARGASEDWLNTIIEIGAGKKTEDSERPDALRVSIDYQVYFVPERQYSRGLVAEHHERFTDHVDRLQRVRLAGLYSEVRAVHG